MYAHCNCPLRAFYMSAVLCMIKEIKNNNSNDCLFQHAATGNITRTPWVTNRQTWDPTVSVSLSQTMDDSTSKGPPWASLPSTSASPEDAQQPRSTGSLLHPAGLLTTPSRLAQSSIASGERHHSPPLQLHLKMF